MPEDTLNHPPMMGGVDDSTAVPAPAPNHPDTGVVGTDGKPKDDYTKLLKQLGDKESYINEQARKISMLENSLSELKGQFTGFTTSMTRNPSEEDVAAQTDEFLSNIPGSLKKFREEIRNEYKEELAKKEKEFFDMIAKREANQMLWNRFYESNEHLKAYREDIVPSVVAELQNKLGGMSQEEAFERIAEAAEKKILSFKKRFGVADTKTDKGLLKTSHDVKTTTPIEPEISNFSDLNKEYSSAISEIVEKAKGRPSVKTQ